MVIGGGHSGLAMSQCLSSRNIDHVVLERGEVGNSWNNDRWDSLTLLTPNWATQLPGYDYKGNDPDGYMTTHEVGRYFQDYARVINAPVQTETNVTSVSSQNNQYRIETSAGEYTANTVVLASGICNLAAVPPFAEELPASIVQMNTRDYRNPEQLPKGGVLVVGASASGLQLADEIHKSGRPVTLSVGEHVRLPRTYRGHDIYYWLDKIGRLDVRYDELTDDELRRGRGLPSPQLAGTQQHATLNLNELTAQGVKLVGRISAIRGHELLFSGGLKNLCNLADLKMKRLAKTIDEWIIENNEDAIVSDLNYVPTRVDNDPALSLDLKNGDIRSVVWATGFRPDYSWLNVDVLDRKGKLTHDGGIVTSSGLYAMGLSLMRRQKSTFIYGATEDAMDVSAHLTVYLGQTTPTEMER